MGQPVEIFVSMTLVPTSCGVCEIRFAMPESKEQRCRDTGASFYCPNGHSLIYKDTEVKRLKAELDIAKKAREEAWTRANAAEGRATKAERKLSRVKSGVCPWCNRQFQNVKRHVECKHKDKP